MQFNLAWSSLNGNGNANAKTPQVQMVEFGFVDRNVKRVLIES
jgi:hypothetical protein